MAPTLQPPQSGQAGRHIAHAWRLAGVTALATACAASPAACTADGARGGLFGIDRCDEFEASGLFSCRNQQRLNAALIGGSLALALWEGTATPHGTTAWKALDGMATSAVATELMKNIFQRPVATRASPAARRP